MEQVKTRAEIDQKYKWNLADIFESDEKWEGAFNLVKAEIPVLKQFKGTLNDKNSLKEFFIKEHNVSLISEKLYVYAKMSRDQDNGNDTYVSMCDRAYSLLMLMETETAFVTPELTKLDDETLLLWANEDVFKDNSLFLKGIVRNKKHLLSEKEERILAQTSEMANSFDTIFTMLDDVDMRFEDIQMADGTKQQLSHGRYGLLLQDKNRDIRKQAYESMYNAHINNINTLAALYSSSVKKDVFYAKVRNFESVLQGELFSGNIPLTVYSGLIEQVHNFLPQMHRYVKLRQELLGIKDGKMYDMYVPLIDVPDTNYTYDAAQELAKKALAPLGEDYVRLLERSFKENWIDVYETKGKTSGAYSWGAYGVHPYMLLNYQGRLDDVFTLVHEAGHSMHTYYSDNSLPYEKAQYRIFVAEVASTVNEVLLLKYMLKNTQDKKMKAYLLNHFIDQFRTTLFRQTMFAEFEWETHKMAENDEPLTVSVLNKIYGDLNRLYYGDGVETDKFIEAEWSRIPHFYRAFYVYQYATGFSSAVAIADMILNEGAPAVERYKNFLSSGGSDFPVELLKITGVDLSKPEPIISALKVFEKTLEEFEGMVK
ncbi:MAG: oligoendopeptidase F [Clostridiales bacterium]|nr:oligoendopeptidase F [Clostridiales bacterium]